MIESNRLILALLGKADVPFILELLNSPGWLEFIGDRGVKTEEDALAYIQNGPLSDFDKHGFCLFKVSLKGSDIPIGLCGLLKRDFLDHPDIGFAFLGEYSGQGYALESSQAVLAWADKQLGIDKVLAITKTDNKRSIGLLEKLGLSYERMVQYPDGASLCLYSY